MRIKSINPTTEEVLGEVDCATEQDVNNAVKKAREAFKEWSKTDISEREKIFNKIASVLRKKGKELSELMSNEMGKPISESSGIMDPATEVFEYYAKEAKKWLEDEEIDIGIENTKNIVRFEPIGVVGCITPWNYPIWIPTVSFAGALITGNTVVFKPSELTPLMSIKFAEVFKEARLPEGVLNLVVGDKETGKALVNSNIDIITLTGSVETGKYIATQAGKDLKRIVLELGGSDPAIVCEDADLDLVINGILYGRFGNCGQVCTAAKRIFVHEKLYDDFLKLFVEKTRDLKIGNPLDESTDIGPMVSSKQRDKLHEQVTDAINKGAKLECGGKKIQGKGFFYKPTVLTNVNENMKVLTEETFGPVAPIVKVKNIDDAIKMANNSKFGLGASIWTEDTSKVFELAKRIESGIVTINDVNQAFPQCPFGGVKQSGMGRELSRHGIIDFVNIKWIYTDTSNQKTRDWWFPYKK